MNQLNKLKIKNQINKLSLILLLFTPLLLLGQTSPKKEFRGVWVASVANIDWPSKPGLKSREQKKEVIKILDKLQNFNMNAVILQIRPTADAFYPSTLEPWSQYLTGIPGKAPSPYYDPLQFWIEESHKRGMELHAWMNPYRVSMNAEEPIAANHIAFQHPDWIIKYGNKLYFDPAIPEVRKFVSDVVKDVVSRYDVDAIHFDDYFYPYPLAEEFPDTLSFIAYQDTFTLANKDDWRRQNVDLIIEKLHSTIKQTKPWVKFGISPFGVWRNIKEDVKGSETTGGFNNYEHLYADILKWLENDWIDYVVPQLYWRIGHPLVDYQTLAHWWGENSFQKNLYIGHGIYKIDKDSKLEEWASPNQIPKQIKLNREISGISGNVLYSYKHLKRDDLLGLQDSLQNNLYASQAIIPSIESISTIKPEVPSRIKKTGRKIKWDEVPSNIQAPGKNRYLVYVTEKGKAFDVQNPSSFIIINEQKMKLKKQNRKKKEYEIRISTLSRLNVESALSDPIIVKL